MLTTLRRCALLASRQSVTSARATGYAGIGATGYCGISTTGYGGIGALESIKVSSSGGGGGGVADLPSRCGHVCAEDRRDRRRCGSADSGGGGVRAGVHAGVYAGVHAGVHYGQSVRVDGGRGGGGRGPLVGVHHGRTVRCNGGGKNPEVVPSSEWRSSTERMSRLERRCSTPCNFPFAGEIARGWFGTTSRRESEPPALTRPACRSFRTCSGSGAAGAGVGNGSAIRAGSMMTPALEVRLDGVAKRQVMGYLPAFCVPWTIPPKPYTSRIRHL